MKYECRKSFLREFIFIGNGGTIECHYYWLHVIVELKSSTKFVKGRALVSEILHIDFNDSIIPRGSERWQGLDEKMDRKVQKIFDSINQMGDPDSTDGRDKCISKSTIDKLYKLGFKIGTDQFVIDKNFKDAFTGEVVAFVTEFPS